jgi:hypothetical protein
MSYVRPKSLPRPILGVKMRSHSSIEELHNIIPFNIEGFPNLIILQKGIRQDFLYLF